MAAADGGDAASGALGAVVGEVAAQAFLAEKLKKGITEEDLPALKERGVNLAKLAAGMAAAAAGADVDTAAHTADNAARNNALDTIWDGLCILYDSGKIAYGLYKDDKGMVREGFIDLASDTAAFFIPMVPAGLSRVARASKAAEVAKIAEAIKAGEAAKATGFKAPNGSWIYPPNDGFLGARAEEVLSVGTKVDRYGAESGNFLAPKGTPFGQRSLPPDSLNSPYTEYVVVRPLPVQYGKTAPWFGQQGGGTQFKTMHSIEWLIKNKHIKGVVK